MLWMLQLCQMQSQSIDCYETHWVESALRNFASWLPHWDFLSPSILQWPFGNIHLLCQITNPYYYDILAAKSLRLSLEGFAWCKGYSQQNSYEQVGHFNAKLKGGKPNYLRTYQDCQFLHAGAQLGGVLQKNNLEQVCLCLRSCP